MDDVTTGSSARRPPSPGRSWWRARLRSSETLGLALTVQVGVLGLLLAALSVDTEDVLDGGELVRVDNPISHFLIERRSPGLTVAMRIITQLGSAYVLVPLLLCVGLLIRRTRRTWWPMAFLVVSSVGATLSSTVIKLLVARPRPDSGALVRALGYAFPSGHSTASSAGWFGIAVVLGFLAGSVARRVLLALAAAVIVLLVGVSRIYLGVHAPTDVLAGWALGTLWVAGTLIVARVFVLRRLGREAVLPPRRSS